MGNQINTCLTSTTAVVVHRRDDRSHPTPTLKLPSASGESPQNTFELTSAKSSNEVHDSIQTCAIDQIFLLCEKGVLMTIQFIVDTNPDVVKELSQRHACCIANVPMDLTPFQLAAACGHHDIIAYLLTIDEVLPDEADPVYGMNALHIASYLGHAILIETLCKDSRIDLSAQTYEGKTALHISIEEGQVYVVDAILRIRPSIDLRVKDLNGDTILHTVAKYPNEKILQLIIQYFLMQQLGMWVQEDGVQGLMQVPKQQLRSTKAFFEVSVQPRSFCSRLHIVYHHFDFIAVHKLPRRNI